MAAVKTAKKRKHKMHHQDDMFVDISMLLNGVYKQMTKKGGLLHGLMNGKTSKAKKKKKKRK